MGIAIGPEDSIPPESAWIPFKAQACFNDDNNIERSRAAWSPWSHLATITNDDHSRFGIEREYARSRAHTKWTDQMKREIVKHVAVLSNF